MRLHRFYISEKIGDQKQIAVKSDELTNQIKRVFRLKTGDKVIIFDGSGYDYECAISDLEKSDQNIVVFDVIEKSNSIYMPEHTITLCASVIKKDKFEWIVEKATELGVTKIVPIISERSEKKGLNEKRLEKIAVEASEQSGRGNVPTIHPIISLKEAIEWVSDNKITAIAFHPDGEVARPHLATEIFIGPEGGWSTDELELFKKHGIPVVSLGKQILRAETAVVSALSLVILDK